MLKHVVMYRLRDASDDVIERLKNNFYGMVGKIDGLLNVECGKDILKSERSFDFCLICTFLSKEAQEAYKTHPAHLPVKEYMHTVAVESKSVDFEF
jgi:Stress responsive A/B Barrel Domain.